MRLLKALLQNRSGFLLLEVLVGIAVFAVVTGGVTWALVSGQESTDEALDRQKAAYLTERALEGVRTIRDTDFSNVNSLDPSIDYTISVDPETGKWSLAPFVVVEPINYEQQNPVNVDGFVTKLRFTPVTSQRVRVTAITEWDFGIKRAGSVTLFTELTDWNTPLTFGNWQGPLQIQGSWAAGGPGDVADIPQTRLVEKAYAASEPKFNHIVTYDNIAYVTSLNAPGLYMFRLDRNPPERVFNTFKLPGDRVGGPISLTPDGNLLIVAYEATSPLAGTPTNSTLLLCQTVPYGLLDNWQNDPDFPIHIPCGPYYEFGGQSVVINAMDVTVHPNGKMYIALAGTDGMAGSSSSTWSDAWPSSTSVSSASSVSSVSSVSSASLSSGGSSGNSSPGASSMASGGSSQASLPQQLSSGAASVGEPDAPEGGGGGETTEEPSFESSAGSAVSSQGVSSAAQSSTALSSAAGSMMSSVGSSFGGSSFQSSTFSFGPQPIDEMNYREYGPPVAWIFTAPRFSSSVASPWFTFNRLLGIQAVDACAAVVQECDEFGNNCTMGSQGSCASCAGQGMTCGSDADCCGEMACSYGQCEPQCLYSCGNTGDAACGAIGETCADNSPNTDGYCFHCEPSGGTPPPSSNSASSANSSSNTSNSSVSSNSSSSCPLVMCGGQLCCGSQCVGNMCIPSDPCVGEGMTCSNTWPCCSDMQCPASGVCGAGSAPEVWILEYIWVQPQNLGGYMDTSTQGVLQSTLEYEGKINDLSAFGTGVVLATDTDVSEYVAIDITDPKAAAYVPGTGVDLNENMDGLTVDYDGNESLVGRMRGDGTTDVDEVIRMDLPSKTLLPATPADIDGMDITHNVRALARDPYGCYVFAATQYDYGNGSAQPDNKEVMIVNSRTNPITPYSNMDFDTDPQNPVAQHDPVDLTYNQFLDRLFVITPTELRVIRPGPDTDPCLRP